MHADAPNIFHLVSVNWEYAKEMRVLFVHSE